MNLWSQLNFIKKKFTLTGRPIGLSFLMIIAISLLIIDFPHEMTSASASGHLGILGQRAPELNLNNWIDADGKKMQPIQLSDYRGKVIYLYFFQDW
jgi:hypothetical protein